MANPGATGPGGKTQTAVTTTWAAAALRKAGIPDTPTGRAVLLLWHRNEGNNMPTSGFNWLNQSQPAQGSTAYNKTGVQKYVSWTQGVGVLAATLKSKKYSSIGQALAKAQVTPKHPTWITRKAAFAAMTAINKSTWRGSGTKGKGNYPSALFTYLKGETTPTGRWVSWTAKELATTTGSGVGGTSGAGNTNTGSPCVWKIGPACLLSASQANAAKGGLLLVAGGVVMLTGLALLAAFGLGSRGAASQLRRVGLGGAGALTGSERRQGATDEAQVRSAGVKASGTETAAGRRIRTNEWEQPFTAADQTLPAPSTRATRSAERRPRATAQRR